MYSLLSTLSLWWSWAIWEKFKNFHMFCALEQYKNNGKKSLLIQDLATQNLWETHMLGHSLPPGTVKSAVRQDQPQTSWLLEGISHFRDGLRMTELHVSQFWLSPHLQHRYNCFPMYRWGDPPKPATGLTRGEGHGFPLWPQLGSWYHFCSILALDLQFPFMFQPCSHFLSLLNALGFSDLTSGDSPLPISPPPTKWKRMPCILFTPYPLPWQDSAHSALGLPLYLRGALAKAPVPSQPGSWQIQYQSL